VLLLAAPLAAQAETSPAPPVVKTIALKVALDPTTFAPAALAYAGQRMDWASSQPLFRMGYIEANPRFTISGRPNSIPISEADGYAKIRRQALTQLALSAARNAAVVAITEVAAARYPEYAKLIRRLSLVERIALGAIVSYVGIVPHLKQTRVNRRLAAGGR
jgi:hypothetical protein